MEGASPGWASGHQPAQRLSGGAASSSRPRTPTVALWPARASRQRGVDTAPDTAQDAGLWDPPRPVPKTSRGSGSPRARAGSCVQGEGGTDTVMAKRPLPAAPWDLTRARHGTRHCTQRALAKSQLSGTELMLPTFPNAPLGHETSRPPQLATSLSTGSVAGHQAVTEDFSGCSPRPGLHVHLSSRDPTSSTLLHTCAGEGREPACSPLLRPSARPCRSAGG